MSRQRRQRPQTDDQRNDEEQFYEIRMPKSEIRTPGGGPPAEIRNPKPEATVRGNGSEPRMGADNADFFSYQ
jgi:hypothetical protein